MIRGLTTVLTVGSLTARWHHLGFILAALVIHPTASWSSWKLLSGGELNCPCASDDTILAIEKEIFALDFSLDVDRGYGTDSWDATVIHLLLRE